MAKNGYNCGQFMAENAKFEVADTTIQIHQIQVTELKVKCCFCFQ